MEKIIVKTGIYSFIVSFFLLVAFMKRIESTTDVDGMTSSVITPFPEFFFTIFRYSVITSIIAVLIAIAYLASMKKNE
ncbi:MULTISPECIES: hypothetical protein [Cytobacillus]|jgi:hypothetical protein|uniref:Group-specific protein n=2 Tax=Cytobacillus TaxID=2675230 RepID=A0ABX3CRM2_9BACI|nr:MULTISPECIES: hypothetical protein [Cytobacillus]EFV75256.1 hypothetical protein HMPREF1013_04501 [Bacillus sp. 2_A_57_CT2]MBY0156783.1 hypothetical protein [Cytobacillus firmus]MBU8731099.1 hypothetical protein [Cytobacillus oceanisediminis]MCM3391334.1 hypothetical protein [Cytobacillus oceanisediminis]MCM3405163.1 hypothetical protein [Cytobacillus oceanisediminis]